MSVTADIAAKKKPLGDDLTLSFDRHLVLGHVVDQVDADPRERFEALAKSVRDRLTDRWIATRRAHEAANPKQVYYLSMEFLIGRSLTNNIINLQAEELVTRTMKEEGLDWMDLAEMEPDAGLGNGGLGRLAACFIDSLATLQIPAIGYGLRYEYGMFRQEIQNGWQVETADNWLRRTDPWEVARPAKLVEVGLNCSFAVAGGQMHAVRNQPSTLIGIPYDRPVVGWGAKSVNTLRLWGAASPDFFNFREFSDGDFIGAVHDKITAEAITRVLYPDDSTAIGRGLRFVQEYFLVACSLADIIGRFRRRGNEWNALPDKVAIQLNDTHPSMAVAELMRILLDSARLSWEEAWVLTRDTLAYTNHTLLPEALEKWPVSMFEQLLPRHLEIIYEINRRFLEGVAEKFPGDSGKLQRVSLIEEQPEKKVRMAHLAVVGSHSTNGVAEIHSRLLRTHVLSDFVELYPDRFNNKTNGVTHRRWLLAANPTLAACITEGIGDKWIEDLTHLAKLAPLADDKGFREKFRKGKREAKVRFANWLGSTLADSVDPDTLFDSQIKRIHEYKRQLLNVLHIAVLYNRIKANPNQSVQPRTFFFAGKAAPAYTAAKLIIKLINSLASAIDSDPIFRGKLRVLFLPDYSVSVAEHIIPASDVSEQISTAGFEASGTSNMKFMMNGALTVGTRDGANIEMGEEVGEDNIFFFGLTAEQVAEARGWYSPWWHYNNDPEARAAIDLLFSDQFNRDEPGIFNPLRHRLLDGGDTYMHLADLEAYVKTQQRVTELYSNQDAWTRKAILNIAHSGKFSSDRSIAEYAKDIWGAQACRVP